MKYENNYEVGDLICEVYAGPFTKKPETYYMFIESRFLRKIDELEVAHYYWYILPNMQKLYGPQVIRKEADFYTFKVSEGMPDRLKVLLNKKGIR